MQVDLAYGRTGLKVSLPDERVDIVEPVNLSGVADSSAALRDALGNPIGNETAV